MATGKLEAAQQRLTRLLEQKKALEAKISREQGLVRDRERKARTRRLIEYGGLVAIAGLDTADKGMVLGLLLEGARRVVVDAKAQQRWQALGDQELRRREAAAGMTIGEGGCEEANRPRHAIEEPEGAEEGVKG